MEKVETIHVMATGEVLLFNKDKEERTSDGWLLDLSPGAWGVHKRTSTDTTQGCIDSLIG